ncbi:MAG TPA: NAD+ synthase [Tepidisphaeraceae bacterium]|nr:NAD+ synthase [Tepidisphaeraceae bacterium]
MKIAIAQINPTVGDLTGNTARHLDFIRRARNAGANLVVFPELSITGYPPKDLLLKPGFIDDNIAAVNAVAREARDIEVIAGFADRNADPIGRPARNSVAVLKNGKITSTHYKTLLPTYDVFDESRYFEPGPISSRNQLVQISNLKIGLSICEDLWNDERLITRRLYHQNPIADLDAAGAEVMINCSASPFVVDKHDFRLRLFSEQARKFNNPLIYANQVGGNDELVFDGNSCVFDQTGAVIAQAKDFEEDLLVVNLPPNAGVEPATTRPEKPRATGLESIYRALVLGLRDYVRKCNFKTAVLGLSGGIDSALVCALAVHAIGKDKVVGIAMPSRFSSDHSLNDARALATNLGIEFQTVPIASVHDAYESLLNPYFAGRPPDITEENLQARVRGAILMAFSNKFGHLLLTTANKSESAVGYSTLYGDMCGGLAVIQDVPKTTVWELSKWINGYHNREIIPQSSIEKVPSAELRPNQTDQDSLPPYEVLDEIIERYVEREMGAAAIVDDGFNPALVSRVIRLIDRSEYKRRQAAPGLKVTSRAFGFGRRMPIAQNYHP